MPLVLTWVFRTDAADDHASALLLEVEVGLALDVEDVAPLLERQARLERELRVDRGPAVPVGEQVVPVGRHRDPGVRLDRLGHLHPADAGHEDLVLDLRRAAVHREHRAVVEVVVEPAGAVAVHQRVAVAEGVAGGGVDRLAVSGRTSRVRPHRLVGGVGVLALERGAVEPGPGAAVGVAPVVARVDAEAEPVAGEDARRGAGRPGRSRARRPPRSAWCRAPRGPSGVVMFTTPLKALAPYSAEPGPRTISTLPRSSSGWVRPFHSCEPRNAIARSRPSCSTSTRRLSDELKPRALTLKSLTPLCTTSTPGHRLQRHRRLAGDRRALEHLLRHHRDRRRRLDDPLGRAGRALDHDLAERDGHRLEAGVRGHRGARPRRSRPPGSDGSRASGRRSAAGPAGTRRSVYLPSAPVTVLCPVPRRSPRRCSARSPRRRGSPSR